MANANKKRNQKKNRKKRNTFKDNFRCGDYHQFGLGSGLLSHQSIVMTTQSYRAQALTEIIKGDLFTNRASMLIYMRNINLRLNIRNKHGYSRGFRIMVVQLRGSVQAADTTSFSDLFVNSTWNKYGPTGTDYDGTLRVNQDEWNLIYDKKFKIPGTTSGDNPSTFIQLNIPIKKYVSYAYNSSSPRKGAMWIILAAYEAPQVDPNAAALEIEGEGQVHFYDVNRIMPIP